MTSEHACAYMLCVANLFAQRLGVERFICLTFERWRVVERAHNYYRAGLLHTPITLLLVLLAYMGPARLFFYC